MSNNHQVRVEELRQLIREHLFGSELMRGVPQFVLHGETESYIKRIRVHIQAFVAQKYTSPSEQREVMSVADDVLHDLQEEINKLCEEHIAMFVNKV